MPNANRPRGPIGPRGLPGCYGRQSVRAFSSRFRHDHAAGGGASGSITTAGAARCVCLPRTTRLAQHVRALDEILKIEIEGNRLPAAERATAQAFVDRLVQQPEGQALVKRVRAMIARSEYKRRQAPPIVRVRSRAFGSGHQMPIAAFHA